MGLSTQAEGMKVKFHCSPWLALKFGN